MPTSFWSGLPRASYYTEVEEAMVHQYNALTPENEMKWSSVQPAQGRFNFFAADRLARFAEENDMKLIGHTLVWHSQTPRWVWEHPDGTPRTAKRAWR